MTGPGEVVGLTQSIAYAQRLAPRKHRGLAEGWW
jgi:hypothetical protein